MASGVQPDDVRTWYEVPEEVAETVRRHIDPDETFVECLMRLCLEREGTYSQVLAENRRLKAPQGELRAVLRMTFDALDTAEGVCQLVEMNRKPTDLHECIGEIGNAKGIVEQALEKMPDAS